MIKIQKKNFNLEEEIDKIKNKHSDIGAQTSFVGYVRDLNNNKDVKYLNLEVYEEMAFKELSKIENNALKKWSLIDTLIIHRYGKLNVNEKIVLVSCFSQHRKDSFNACEFIMDYLKKDAPFWKNEFYYKDDEWLENSK
jgi:Molybdopterin converting factor, large subunit